MMIVGTLLGVIMSLYVLRQMLGLLYFVDGVLKLVKKVYDQLYFDFAYKQQYGFNLKIFINLS